MFFFGCLLGFVFVLGLLLLVLSLLVCVGLTLPRPWVPKYGTSFCNYNDCHYRHDERSMGSKKRVFARIHQVRKRFHVLSFSCVLAEFDNFCLAEVSPAFSLYALHRFNDKPNCVCFLLCLFVSQHQLLKLNSDVVCDWEF